jgi:HAD superfamily hydrolase (TIGR01549 family)
MQNRDPHKMVVFDLDNTLLQAKFIDVCAEKYNFRQALALVRQLDYDAVSLTRRMASFLRDRRKKELTEIAENIPLVFDTVEVVNELKNRNYKIGIITDSYQFVSQMVARKIGADFELSNELVFIAGSTTGEVLVPSFFHYSNESTCKHQVCKTNALRHICKKYKVNFEDCIAVGVDESSACMIEHAGTGVSFCTTGELIRKVADKHIGERSFSELLNYAV